jgi:hypothetical protein
MCWHITLCQHFSATAEEQVSDLVKRVKELTGMPDPVNFQIIALQILLPLLLFSILKSFLILLTSNPCRWKDCTGGSPPGLCVLSGCGQTAGRKECWP